MGYKRVTGIGPATTAWKAVVLPLNYTRVKSARADYHLLSS